MAQKINSCPLGGTRSAWHRRWPPKLAKFLWECPPDSRLNSRARYFVWTWGLYISIRQKNFGAPWPPRGVIWGVKNFSSPFPPQNSLVRPLKITSLCPTLCPLQTLKIWWRFVDQFFSSAHLKIWDSCMKHTGKYPRERSQLLILLHISRHGCRQLVHHHSVRLGLVSRLYWYDISSDFLTLQH